MNMTRNSFFINITKTKRDKTKFFFGNSHSKVLASFIITAFLHLFHQKKKKLTTRN